MASSAVCVLVYDSATASIQTLWQAAVVLLHPSGAELCVRARARAPVSMCALVQYVRPHFWECDCIPERNVCFHRHVRTVWVCAVAIPLHSESHSLKPHQRVCGRQNDKARNQPASACSHTQTHAHTLTHTYSYLRIHHTYPSSYWHTHTLALPLPVSLSPTSTHTFNANRHRTTSPIQWSPLRPRMQSATEGDVCVCILSHRQTSAERRAE